MVDMGLGQGLDPLRRRGTGRSRRSTRMAVVSTGLICQVAPSPVVGSNSAAAAARLRKVRSRASDIVRCLRGGHDRSSLTGSLRVEGPAPGQAARGREEVPRTSSAGPALRVELDDARVRRRRHGRRRRVDRAPPAARCGRRRRAPSGSHRPCGDGGGTALEGRRRTARPASSAVSAAAVSAATSSSEGRQGMSTRSEAPAAVSASLPAPAAVSTRWRGWRRCGRRGPRI